MASCRQQNPNASNGCLEAHVMKTSSSNAYSGDRPVPKTTASVGVHSMFRHIGESYGTIPNLKPIKPGGEAQRQQPSGSASKLYSKTVPGLESAEFPSHASLTQPGANDAYTQFLGTNLDEILLIPYYKRLPRTFSIPLGRPDPFVAIIERIRHNPEMFATFDVEPKALDLVFGGSHNELANAIAAAIECGPALRAEKFAIAYLCYMYCRVSLFPSIPTAC